MFESLKDILNVVKKKRLDLFYKVSMYPFFWFKGHEGFNVVDEDWENLIVLDSCRYDAFQEVNSIPGELSMKKSKGTTTVQWLNQNFTEYHDDIAYLSTVSFVHPDKASDANFQRKPFNASEHFSVVENISGGKGIEQGKHVDPEETVEKAKAFAEKYPGKRKIIHFTPPHLPFLTSEHVEEHNYDTYEQYLREGYSWDDLRKEYRETLEYTLEHVEELVEELEGKTIVTGDHGEAHNEYFVKDHPHSIYIKPLVNVPWLEAEED
jgi:arylsulfatase A-like enzyme